MPERFKVVFTMQGAIQVLGFTFLPLALLSSLCFSRSSCFVLFITSMLRAR